VASHSSLPTNTLAAIALAIEQGAQWIEVDVNISSDGELFIHHDDTLSRCTDGQGYLVGTSAQDLSELDAGSWFAEKFAGEKIPTLAQLTEFLLPHGTGVNLEMKATAGADIRLAQAVSEFIALCRRFHHTRAMRGCQRCRFSIALLYG